MVVYFLGLVMFTAAAAHILLTIEPEEFRAGYGFGRIALWLALVLCPVLAVDTLARIIRRTPNVVATDQGLAFRSILGFSDPIPWPEIGGFRAVIMGKRPYLAVYLEAPVETFARMNFWTRMMHARSHAPGVPNIVFRSIQLGSTPDEAAEALEKVRKLQAARA
jgi:hypothetical protein